MKLGQEFRIVKTNLGRESSKLWRKFRAPAGMKELPPKYPQDFSEFSKQLLEQVRPCTMTSPERIITLEYAVRYLVKANIPGDLVETGVGAGGSMMAAAYTLLELHAGERDLYLYDTYAGMATPSDRDISILGKPAMRKYARKVKDGECTWHNYPIELVRDNMLKTGYDESRIKLVKGLVQDTLPGHGSSSIALLRLDTNLYESTCCEMEELFPKLSVGGVFIVDDYNRWIGQREAIDEYFDKHNINMLLTRIDDHAVQGTKQ